MSARRVSSIPTVKVPPYVDHWALAGVKIVGKQHLQLFAHPWNLDIACLR